MIIIIPRKEGAEILKRKIYDRLLEWKEKDNGSCALLLDGARRVGKSYIAEQFGKNEYKSYISDFIFYIDLLLT